MQFGIIRVLPYYALCQTRPAPGQDLSKGVRLKDTIRKERESAPSAPSSALAWAVVFFERLD